MATSGRSAGIRLVASTADPDSPHHHDVAGALQKLAQTSTDHFVVVEEEHADRGHNHVYRESRQRHRDVGPCAHDVGPATRLATPPDAQGDKSSGTAPARKLSQAGIADSRPATHFLVPATGEPRAESITQGLGVALQQSTAHIGGARELLALISAFTARTALLSKRRHRASWLVTPDLGDPPESEGIT